jgi:hypothetical protein
MYPACAMGMSVDASELVRMRTCTLFCRSRRPRHGQVDVADRNVLASLEIRVADVAAAGDRDRVVADEELVVHPVVEPARLEQVLGTTQDRERAPRDKRVVDSDADVRVRGEGADHRSGIECRGIVEQQAHARAAIRGL